jgi:hypothetical protein
VHAGDVHLLAQGVQVVGREQEVLLGFERVGRMAPVAAREDPQLPAAGKLFKPGLHGGEIDRRRRR